jgi:hypothetical protein
MSRQENLSRLAQAIVAEMNTVGLFNTCCNCIWWQDYPELCTKFKERPPAKVIVKGCEWHELIPF